MGAAIELNPVQDVEIIDYGRITDQDWPGSVSADALIKVGETTKETIDEAVARLEEFYVPASSTAKTRCIDGRHDPKLDEAHLGPQVPGGAPGAALAYRLGVDKGDVARGTFLEDAEAMIGEYTRMGFAPGGHRDRLSDGEEMVGCGAIDGMDRIVQTMTEKGLVNDHKRVVDRLLGGRFESDNYLRVMGAAVVVNDRSEEYFDGRGKVMNALERRDKDSTAVLEGEHKECLVAVNLVPGTTLSSNRFSETFDGIQAFGYDLWWSEEIANKLLPRPEQAQDRERFVMARVMATVATLMALTDGSQRLVLRTAASTEEE